MAIDFSTIKAITIPEGTVKKIQSGTTVLWQLAKTLSSITISGQTTSLTRGASYSFGGTVTAHYSDGSTATVTSSSTFSGYNMSVSATYTVTVSYTYDGVTKTTTYSLTVNPKWETLWTGSKTVKTTNNGSTKWSTEGKGDICTANSASRRFRVTFSGFTSTSLSFSQSTSYGIWWGGTSATRATTIGSSPKDITPPSATADLLYCKGYWNRRTATNPWLSIYHNSSGKIGLSSGASSTPESGYTCTIAITVTKIEQYY